MSSDGAVITSCPAMAEKRPGARLAEVGHRACVLRLVRNYWLDGTDHLTAVRRRPASRSRRTRRSPRTLARTGLPVTARGVTVVTARGVTWCLERFAVRQLPCARLANDIRSAILAQINKPPTLALMALEKSVVSVAIINEITDFSKRPPQAGHQYEMKRTLCHRTDQANLFGIFS